MRCKIKGLVSLFVIATLLTACGVKDAEDVIADLSDRSKQLDSYMSHGTLTIFNGKKPQNIEVEVWFQKPQSYRVLLKNPEKKTSQIILKNKEGVYVLTPHLKKSFRFQSSWPENSGQIYLYQTLLGAIIESEKPQFQKEDDLYRFEMKASNTLHNNWSKQKIWLDRDYHPKKVDVLNQEDEVVVRMSFDRFQSGATFDKDSFDRERNLKTATPDTKPTLSQQQDFAAITPGYIPKQSRLVDEQTIDSAEGPVVIMRFQGQQPFTLTQRKSSGKEVRLPFSGEPVALQEAMGVILETGDYRRLWWNQDGVDYNLIGNLSKQELVQIANSASEQPDK